MRGKEGDQESWEQGERAKVGKSKGRVGRRKSTERKRREVGREN